MKAGPTITAVVDLLIAAAVGLLIVWLFGVAGQSDTAPPICTNRSGNTIDCDQDRDARIAAWIVFGVVLLGLWAFHARRALGFRRDRTG